MAQEESNKGSNLDFDIGADLMSRYVWRGTQFGGNGPSVQPGITMSWKGLEVGFWGAYSLNGINNVQELDLYASYTFLDDMFSVAITDYFFPDEALVYNPFEYKKDTTAHILEGTLSFNGTEKFPISILLAMNFYGADAEQLSDDPNSTDFNQKTGIQNSTYLEFGYSTTIRELSFDAFAGFNLTSPKEANLNDGYVGETGYYGSKRGMVNLGFTLGKEIPVTELYSIPLSASIITNPVDDKIYFVLGISF